MGNAREEIWVLLVDDSEDEHIRMREYLNQRGKGDFLFDGVMTQEEVSDRISFQRYDVVLVGSSKGAQTGLEMLDALPGLTARYPVIMLTEGENPEVDREALKRGVFDFIDKHELTPVLLERSLRYAVNNFRIQQNLRERTRQFESLFDAIFEGVLVHDGVRILEVNHSFLSLFGVQEHEIVGGILTTLFHEPLVKVLNTVTQDESSFEVNLHRRDETQITVEVRVREHTFLGKPCRLVAFRDMTRRKQAEEELLRINVELELRVAQRTESLERSNRDLERFAEIVAHDIQSPLRTVLQCIEKTKERELAVAGHEEDPFTTMFIDRAIQTVHRVQDVVCGVLEYSRITRDCALSHVVDLNGLVQEVLMEFHRQIEEKNAYISLETLPIVSGDRALLAALFNNLLDNALKYCKDRYPCISIGAQDEGSVWLFSISDNGIGFRSEEAEAIFNMFYRSENSSSIQGSGIGLSSCKRIVQLHGGRMWAVAEPGRGATFYFTLSKLQDANMESLSGETQYEETLCRR